MIRLKLSFHSVLLHVKLGFRSNRQYECHYFSYKWLIEAWWRIFTLKHIEAGQHGRHFTDDTFKRIFLNENVIISMKISLKFVPKGPINNIPALVQIMTRRRPGDKPLSEAMMASLLTHICVTRPQWVNENGHHWFKFWLFVCSVANHTFTNADYRLSIEEHIFQEFGSDYKHFSSTNIRKCILKRHLQNIVQASVS